MKRRDLIRHLEKQGCQLLREGGNHTVYVNPGANRVSAVPRHREINEFLARKICRDLGISEPSATSSLHLTVRREFGRTQLFADEVRLLAQIRLKSVPRFARNARVQVSVESV